ncbi:MAG: segregation/condensation protein A [bacterium]
MLVWQVRLPDFEGPLDLLLFLVTRQELNILDLPIAHIAEQYLRIIETSGVESLEEAGEYLVMSATLLAIKARMMLPRPEPAAEEEMEDPRLDLARRLLLYQEVKQAAHDFARREQEMELRAVKLLSSLRPDMEVPFESMLERVSLYDLAKAYEDVRRRFEEQTVHQVSLFQVTLEERMAWVLKQLEEQLHFSFSAVLRLESVRLLWVISFLAVLELARRQKILLDQNLPFSDIWVRRAEGCVVEAA